MKPDLPCFQTLESLPIRTRLQLAIEIKMPASRRRLGVIQILNKDDPRNRVLHSQTLGVSSSGATPRMTVTGRPSVLMHAKTTLGARLSQLPTMDIDLEE